MHLLTTLSGKLYFPTCLTDHSSVVFDQSGNSLVLRVSQNAYYPQITSVNVSCVDCSKLLCWTYMCTLIVLLQGQQNVPHYSTPSQKYGSLPCWSDVHFTYVHCNESLLHLYSVKHIHLVKCHNLIFIIYFRKYWLCSKIETTQENWSSLWLCKELILF